MKEAISETDRRRKIQLDYNKKHGLKPKPIIKAIASGLSAAEPAVREGSAAELEAAMLKAAEELNFEEAARIRDQLAAIKKN